MATPRYSTKKLTDIFPSSELFVDEWNESGLSRGQIEDDSVDFLFYLLYGRYGNNPIANLDENQFKFKLWSIIATDGPNWEKRCSIQERLRQLTEDELNTEETINTIVDNEGTTDSSNNLHRSGETNVNGKNIDNHAMNPSSAPATDVDEPLNFINEQTYSHGKNDTIVDAKDEGTSATKMATKSNSKTSRTGNLLRNYSAVWDILDDEPTERFLGKFKNCFKIIVIPEFPTIYETEIEP